MQHHYPTLYRPHNTPPAFLGVSPPSSPCPPQPHPPSPAFPVPGALYAPISDTDIVLAGLELMPVTMVFCMVDGGKAFAARHRRDAPAVHRTLAAVVCSVLRQVRLPLLASSAKAAQG